MEFYVTRSENNNLGVPVITDQLAPVNSSLGPDETFIADGASVYRIVDKDRVKLEV